MKIILSALLMSGSLVCAMHEQLSSIDITKKLLTDRLQHVVLAGSLQDFKNHGKLLHVCDYDTIKFLERTSNEYVTALNRVREARTHKCLSTKDIIQILSEQSSVLSNVCGHVVAIMDVVNSLSDETSKEYIESEKNRLMQINDMLSQWKMLHDDD